MLYKLVISTFCITIYVILLMHIIAMNYRVLVVGEGKHFGLSTACLYVTLAGEYGMTETLDMPRGEYQTETTVRKHTHACTLCIYMYIHTAVLVETTYTVFARSDATATIYFMANLCYCLRAVASREWRLFSSASSATPTF